MTGSDAEPQRPQTSSVLFKSPDQRIVVVDIPRSLEESQVLWSQETKRRIYSVSPLTTPFATPEPRDHDGLAAVKSPAAELAELMTTATVASVLQELHSCCAGGPFHLPRLLPPHDPSLFESSPTWIIPEKAEALHGSIQVLSKTFDTSAPTFDLIVMDPPWPNRSARRKTKDKYATVSNLSEMRSLLLSIPVASHLAPAGLVAVWITNKHSIYEFLTSPTGMFASWGLEVVTEWTWVKVTASGEPIFDIESRWRKPWEKLIIAKRIGRPERLPPKVIVAVPDLHSRKPNLRGLFQDVFQKNYLGLEIFARNLTAGWWSWGDDVYRFQQPQYWKGTAED